MLGGTAVTDRFCGFRVNRALPLFIPVKGTAGICHLVVDVTGMGDLLCDIGCVGCDAGGDYSLLNVIIWS